MKVSALHDVSPELARDETRILHPIDRDDTEARLLLEFYCADPDCDCRRVVLGVVRVDDGRQIATISHRFGESGDDEPHDWPTDRRTFLNDDHPQAEAAEEFLDVFEESVLSSNYERRLEHHYERVKASDEVETVARTHPEVRDEFDPSVFGEPAESEEGPVYLADEEVEEAARERRRQRRLLSRSERGNADKAAKLARYEVDRCFVNGEWQSARWSHLTVARRIPGDEYAVLFVLLDLGCLGIKNYALETGMDAVDLDDAVDRIYGDETPAIACTLDLASRILHHGVTWSERAGFDVGEGYFVADAFLGDADPKGVDTPVPLGRDGEPFYVPSPGDDWEAVMEQLDDQLGADNYGYLIPSEVERNS